MYWVYITRNGNKAEFGGECRFERAEDVAWDIIENTNPEMVEVFDDDSNLLLRLELSDNMIEDTTSKVYS